MAEFEYRTPVIPQRNFKNISSKRCQILESGSLNYYNLNLQHMLIQEYKQVLTAYEAVLSNGPNSYAVLDGRLKTMGYK
jgi:hypothetical protein